MTNKTPITLVLAAILVVVAFFALMLYIQNSVKGKELDDKVSLINALSDSLKIRVNKDSSSTGTTGVVQTYDPKDFLRLQTKDIELQVLQKIVDDYRKQLQAGSSVTTGLIQTIASLKGNGPIVIKSDTVRKDSFIYVYPTYQDSLNNKWVNLKSRVGKDSSHYDIAFDNEFSAIVGKSKGKPFVDLNLSNPYSKVKQLRSYQVTIPKPKKWGVGPNLSYGIDGSLNRNIFIGVGVQYNIIRF